MKNIKIYDTASKLDAATSSFIKKTPSVIDIGCGIRPQWFFKPHLHLCIEPYQEYIDILKDRFHNEPGFIVLKGSALTILPLLPDKIADSIFMVDVIEHLEKEEGFKILNELKRIARKQVIIFTPHGFMPQEYEKGDIDAWGLGGTDYQEHKSGWLPEDFGSDWTFHLCHNYHNMDSHLRPLEKPFGAFWAILNISEPVVLPYLPKNTIFVGKSLPPENSTTSNFLGQLLNSAHPNSFGIASFHADFTTYSPLIQNFKNRPKCSYYFFKMKRLKPDLQESFRAVYQNILTLVSFVTFLRTKKYRLIASVGLEGFEGWVIKFISLITGTKFITIDPSKIPKDVVNDPFQILLDLLNYNSKFTKN